MKKLLIVVDYQNDFVDGALGFSGAEKLEEPICTKIDSYFASGSEVCFTFDTHKSDYLNTAEGRGLPIAHCVENTSGHLIYGRVADYVCASTKCFMKPTFGSSELFDYLRDGKYDLVELVGLVSHICVLSNAVLAKSALPDAEIIVDAHCTASYDKEIGEKALDILSGIMVNVINR